MTLRNAWRWGCAVFVCALACSSTAYAAEGALDPNFGSGGTAVTSLATPAGNSSIANAVAIDSQSRVITAGYAGVSGHNDFAVARYLPGGQQLDPAFSGDGKMTVKILAGAEDFGQGVAIDSQGRIIVAGWTTGGGTGDNFAVIRLRPDGTLDPSFSGDGILTISFGPGDDLGGQVAVDSSDRVVVAGITVNGGQRDPALARLKADGTLDTSFDGDGRLVADWDPNASVDRSAGAVLIDPQGRILTGDGFGGPGSSFIVARYLDDGRPDTSFGDSGVQRIETGATFPVVRGIALDSLGRIIVGGSGSTTASVFLVARLDTGGTLDTSFGASGVGTGAVPGNVGSAEDLALDSQDRILVVGASRPDDFRATVARFDENGNLDTTFGNGGFAVDTVGKTSRYHEVAVDEHDGIVAAGERTRGDGSNIIDFITSRYIDDETAPTPDIGFADGAYFNSATPSLPFSASEKNANFGCELDEATPQPCTSPFVPTSPLSEGQHTFGIIVADRAGNFGGGTTRTFTIDTVAPLVDVSGKEKIKSHKKKARATFAVGASEPVTLTCAVDGGAPTPCDGTFTTPKLKKGAHAVTVEGRDLAGNTGSQTMDFKVVRKKKHHHHHHHH